MNSLEVNCAGETLQLFAARAAFWAKRKTLLIADTHLGKASAFRHAGIAVPEQVTDADLQRLSNLLTFTQAARLVVLGDLFHARAGKSEATIKSVHIWREQHLELQIDLLIGNHDRATGDLPNDWNIRATEEFREPPLLFAHEAREAEDAFGLFGHVHPAIFCDRMRLPCFHFWNDGGMLPAFGSFTGTHPIKPAAGDTVFAVRGDEIADVSNLLRCR
ncbi:MAG: metallophosphoesterase [Verrucomicrobiales bacterium]|nr:metallophosphoesterase [Verrucomicrobiales bacterium]